MIELRVAPIVEGHGEVSAFPILLRNIWHLLLGGIAIEVLRPIRNKRNLLAAKDKRELGRAVTLAAMKLAAAKPAAAKELILILVDADRDLPCVLGPEITAAAAAVRRDKGTVCIVANVEYETWFVAAADSLRKYLDLTSDPQLPSDPERLRLGKGWIKARMPTYSETVDQPKLSAVMDLQLCRRQSTSFDKLCRELERQN
ncbi:MAG TPA: DUF4276 family protein [Pirellulaceae bacterium]|nr:DUF4276 family protein [Pirellulaceae bacterium]